MPVFVFFRPLGSVDIAIDRHFYNEAVTFSTSIHDELAVSCQPQIRLTNSKLAKQSSRHVAPTHVREERKNHKHIVQKFPRAETLPSTKKGPQRGPRIVLARLPRYLQRAQIKRLVELTVEFVVFAKRDFQNSRQIIDVVDIYDGIDVIEKRGMSIHRPEGR